MKILNHKDAINRRLYKGLIIVETAIYRVFWLNRTVLSYHLPIWQEFSAKFGGNETIYF
ncbi:hypothetical protein [Nostoc sphaeroides]|uniref:Uncharacterized protein n=1 Tax=Nostoc sphaeroides CCNUC1 TaxID=2653204 RepID=A0A5P8W0R6_9NOSO|nr:hypothetical protein [Nostoc sphaeroides]MCC5630327.1 hypothetical protein [Nostoc sphaeroides CHAB 2801]QFS46191.1 hypothetical protein GXM_03671 [Nostoc sphaeroides CCNUC1]